MRYFLERNGHSWAADLLRMQHTSLTFAYVRKIARTMTSISSWTGRGASGSMKGNHLGEFEELVLLAVRQLGEDANVIAIQDVLSHAANRSASLGAIYAALDRAQRKSLVESWLGDSRPERGGRARRYYGLTEEGETALSESRRVREAMWTTSREVAR